MWMLLIHLLSTNIELFLSALMQPFHSLYFSVSCCDLKTQVLSAFISVELTHEFDQRASFELERRGRSCSVFHQVYTMSDF